MWNYLIQIIIRIFKPDFLYERYTSNQITNSSKYNIPLVLEINGWPPDYMDQQWNEESYNQWEMRFIDNFSKASLIITSSRGLEGKVKNLIANKDTSVRFIPNGVDLPGKEVVQKSLFESNEIRVGYIGGFTDLHDVRSLLLAIKIIFDMGLPVRLLLFGDGENKNKYEKMCSEIGIDTIVEFYS